MEFIDFLGEMLGITKDFAVTKIEKNELEKTINIHIEYLPKTYSKNGKAHPCTNKQMHYHLSFFYLRFPNLKERISNNYFCTCTLESMF